MLQYFGEILPISVSTLFQRSDIILKPQEMAGFVAIAIPYKQIIQMHATLFILCHKIYTLNFNKEKGEDTSRTVIL